MPKFDLSQYETVESRLVRFWDAYPTGRISTDLVSIEGQRYIVRAEVYADAEDVVPRATGYAEETIGSSPVNKTSALENCETSAIGRALANWTFQAKGAPRPSREEMSKVAGQSVRHEAPKVPAETIIAIREAAAAQGLAGEELRARIVELIGREVGAFNDLTEADCAIVLEHFATNN